MRLQAPLWAAAMADARPHVAAALLRSLLHAAPFTPHHVRYLVITTLLHAAPLMPHHSHPAALQPHGHGHGHGTWTWTWTWVGMGCEARGVRRGGLDRTGWAWTWHVHVHVHGHGHMASRL
jgi:hypothetical protein